MATRLSKGTRVRMNEHWGEWGKPTAQSLWQVGTEATVIGHAGKSHDLYWLVVDGHPTRQCFHRNFFTVVEG